VKSRETKETFFRSPIHQLSTINHQPSIINS
jgi:hypothetical protein